MMKFLKKKIKSFSNKRLKNTFKKLFSELKLKINKTIWKKLDFGQPENFSSQKFDNHFEKTRKIEN